MTTNQQIFCDEWLKDRNGARAYKVAYPHVKKDSTAAAAASRLLTNVNVQEYVQKKLKEMESERIADATEVLTMLTRVMRREEDETVVVTCKSRISGCDDNGKKKIEEREEPVLVKIPTKVSDANKAAEMLAKRYGLLGGNVEIESGDSGIVINITPASQAPSEDDLS